MAIAASAPTVPGALAAYESLAPYYDELTADYDHERWLAALEGEAKRLGLSGRRVLDAGCGTGKSFVPMLRRGYEVFACDLSPSMVAWARRRHPKPEHVVVADARALPEIGPFDLVTFLDDALNYLLDEADLDAAFSSFARVLRRDGLLVFDTNTLATYRTAFATDSVVSSTTALIRWRGRATTSFAPGDVCSATIEVLPHAVLGTGEPITSQHVQRHHPRELVETSCSRAGLDCVAVLGQLPGARLSNDVDEERHTKTIYIARRSEAVRGR
jgi:SAM-dependent methyltransferase